MGQLACQMAGTGYTNGANLTVSLLVEGVLEQLQSLESILLPREQSLSTLIKADAGYINASNMVISFSGGGGTGAAGTAIISGNVVTQVIMTNPGTGYSNSAKLTVTISGGGATNNAVLQGIVASQYNTGIATFSGRVWIAQGRTIYYSAAGSYSDFTSVSAGSVTLTDTTLHGNIQQLLSANNFLYIFGDDSINVFSDVRVTNTVTTLFTNTNVSASVGTKLAYAIFPYFRSVFFMNNYGIYALVGSTTQNYPITLTGCSPILTLPPRKLLLVRCY